MKNAAVGAIRVGVGGWTYEPWRNNFYPPGLVHDRELEYASRHLTAIEINGTYYRLQSPASFAKWRDATPDGFVFSVKASRYSTNRRVLGEAGESIAKFLGSGLAELGDKLGPVVWQFAPTKKFEPDDFAAFLRLLPASTEGLPLRHAVEVRHASFACADYLALARQHRVATVFADSDQHPSFADLSGDFVYARLMKTQAECATGYPDEAIRGWATAADRWSNGLEPSGLPTLGCAQAEPKPRDVFMFFISGAKERAPAAALATLAALGKAPVHAEPTAPLPASPAKPRAARAPASKKPRPA